MKMLLNKRPVNKITYPSPVKGNAKNTYGLLILIVLLVQAVLFMGTVRAGTINDPDIIVNGQLDTFSTNIDENWYTFSLREAGNILIAGENAFGGTIYDVSIYYSDLSQVGVYAIVASRSISLPAGSYYLQFTEDAGGTFRLSSTQLIPGSGLPSPDYTAGYNAGYDAGIQACTDDPESCGIELGGDFYVIPFPVPAK